VSRWSEAGHAVAAEVARRAAERRGDRLDTIVLFGSVARGTDGPESDVDVLVIASGFDGSLRDALDAIAFEVTLAAGRAPSLVLYPRDAWERARRSGSELVAAVEREGVTLWTRNDAHSSARG